MSTSPSTSTNPSTDPSTGSGASTGTATGPAPILRFRHHRARPVASLILAISLLTLTTVSPWLALLCLPPLTWAGWLLRSGTDSGPAGLRVRGLLGARRVGWHEVALLHADQRGQVMARLTNGTDLPLTAVRAAHLAHFLALGELRPVGDASP